MTGAAGPPQGATPGATRCPSCLTQGLNLDIQLVTAPQESVSLPGTQTKSTGRFRPVLSCPHCGVRVVGEFEAGHARFDPARFPDLPDGGHAV